MAEITAQTKQKLREFAYRKINLIACASRDFGIGYDGDLLFNCRDDMKLFSALTSEPGVYLVVGYKTLYDMVFHGKGKLNNRKLLVLCSRRQGHEKSTELMLKHIEDHWTNTQVTLYYDSEMLVKKAQEYTEFQTVYVIGGDSVYKLFSQHKPNLILTYIDAACLHDTSISLPEEIKDNITDACQCSVTTASGKLVDTFICTHDGISSELIVRPVDFDYTIKNP